MRRSTVVMLVLLVIVAGLYWYSQQPGNAVTRVLNPGPTATTSYLGFLVSPEQGPVSHISIERADGKSVVLDNSTGSWMVVAVDGSYPADPASAEGAISQVQSLRIVAKLDSAPDAAATGLDKPAYTFTFTLVDGSTMILKVGKSTVTQSGYYIGRQDGSVVIVGTYSIDPLTELVDAPPYLHTPTPSPVPPTETPVPTAAPTETPVPTLEATSTP
jgi:hypothetical protein